MNLLLWYTVLGLVQAALGLWVVMAQPRRTLNWAVGAFLILWAASGVVFQLWREATAPGERLAYVTIGRLYEAPTFLLILLAIDGLLVPAPKPRWRPWLLGAGCVVLVVFWVGHASATTADLRDALGGINAIANQAAQIMAILLCAWAASDARRSDLQRRKVALFGLAFALLLAHTGSSGLTATVSALKGGLGFPATFPANALMVIGLLGLGASLLGAVWLPAPFRRGARVAVSASILLSCVVGAVSYGSVAGLYIPGGRVVAVSAFSIVLAVAVLRFDLAAAGATNRRRVQAAATVLLSLCVGAILAVAAWSATDTEPMAFALAGLALLAPIALLVTPLKRLPAWVTRRVLLHSHDPEALRERVRVYATTLRAATGRDGQVAAAAQSTLTVLRSQLGLSQRDHDLLVSMGGDQNASGLVAYRLALVGAANEHGQLNEAQLRSLRSDLGVTEREHALVLEHVQAGADSLSAGARFLGRYHVLRRLAEGGFGEVWLAHDTRKGVDVVLKHLTGHDRRDGAALRRIQNEVDAANALVHSNIVAVQGVETVGDDTYLVMEYMAGGSLADLLHADGPLPETQVVQIAEQVLDALQALHRRGFVHRDIKPGNILFDAQGNAKLGDFNIARDMVSGETIGPDGTRAPVGTFAYMSIGQARGMAAQPGHDLYGLAATLYEALAGAPLMDLVGLSHAEAIARIAQQPLPVAVPNASPQRSAAILQALGPPESGFANAEAMKAAISPAGAITGAEKPTGSDPHPPRHQASGRQAPRRPGAS